MLQMAAPYVQWSNLFIQWEEMVIIWENRNAYENNQKQQVCGG